MGWRTQQERHVQPSQESLRLMLAFPHHFTAVTSSYAALTHETWQRPEDLCLMGTVVGFQGLIFL